MKYEDPVIKPKVRLFYNSDNKNINKQIEDGKTTAFTKDERREAQTLADEKETYVYDIFNSNFKFCGYAVPN